MWCTYPVKGGWVLGCKLQLADDHFIHRDAVLPHVLQNVDEIGVVQPLEGRIDEGAIDVGIGSHLAILEHHKYNQGDGDIGHSVKKGGPVWHVPNFLGSSGQSHLLCRPAARDKAEPCSNGNLTLSSKRKAYVPLWARPKQGLPSQPQRTQEKKKCCSQRSMDSGSKL